jgi:beta-lactamase regulating signal transducer with metallopeptidase domain
VTASASELGVALVDRLGWCLVHSVWQGAAVALVAACVLRWLRRSSAQARYLTACGGLLAMVFLPLATPIPADARLDADPGTPISIDHAVPESSRGLDHQSQSEPIDRTWRESRALLADQVQPGNASRWRVGGMSIEPMLPWLVGAWAVGVFVLSLRLLGGWVWIQWLVQEGSRPVEKPWRESLKRLQERLRVGRPVRLLQSARLQVPLAVGWLRPVILLPVTALTALPSDQLEAILAHELAHIRRFDYLVNLVQSVVETLLFYHPAAWWISARIRAEREHCCDDWAVEVCGDRLLYARALAALEERRSAGWLLAPSARDGSLLGRIRRLVGASSSVEKPTGALAGTVALATVVLLAVAFVLSPAGNQARAAVGPGEAITGSVVTTDGKPVAGTDVWLVAHLLTENRAVTFGKAQTDGEGRFRLTPDEERIKMRHLNFRALWAYKPGMQLATFVSRDNPRPLGFDPARPVTLTLYGPATATLRIVDPANKPIAGAKVTLTGLDEGFTAPPGDLVDRLAARTDNEGRAILIGAPINRIRGLRIQNESFGTQNFYTHLGFKPDEPFRLRTAVAVEGRVTADEPAAVRGLPLYFSASPEEARDLTKLIPHGEALVVTDEEGRFRIPALATGKLFTVISVPDQSMYRAPQMNSLEITATKHAEIVMALRRMVRVRGVVKEKGTGKPIPNIGVIFGSRELAELLPMAITDERGQYEAIAPPGANSQFHLSNSKVYFSPLQGFLGPSGGNELPIGPVDGQVLPAIELDRGVTLRGIVVDGEGKPVMGAAVEGKWDRIHAVNSPNNAGMAFAHTFTATAKTDADGTFLLEGIHPGANVTLEASEGDARTDRPTQAAAGTTTLTKLVVSGANTVALFGRVVDVADNPIVGALVQVRSRPVKSDGYADASPIRFDGGEIRTDRDGRFRTPRQLKRGYGYRVEIKPPDETFMPENSPWLAIKADTRPFLSKIALRRLRTVHGRVVNSRGKPVAGASVRQAGDGPAPTQVVTDTDGRFALPGVLAEPAYVFVAKDGYRFVGRPITATDAVVEVTLSGVDEPDPRIMKTVEPLLSRAEELAALHRVFDTYAERVIEEGTARELFDVLGILVWLDPGRVIELLGDQRLDPWQSNNIRLTLATQLVRHDDKEARELIEAIQDTEVRSYAYSEASFALADTARARKLDLLNESLVAGRAVVDPEDRVLRLADIGGRLFDLGQTEEATKIVQEARVIASKLGAEGRSAWARGRLAEELAQVDLPAAFSLLRGSEHEREHDRYLGRIAYEIARLNPAEAEKVLMMMRDKWPHFRDEYTQKVCYRMVTVDRQRAMRLAAGMKNYRYRARALGAMALALEKTEGDHATALRLLDEAFEVLDQSVEERKDDWDGLGMACTAAAGLLPIIEQVEPRRLSEFAGAPWHSGRRSLDLMAAKGSPTSPTLAWPRSWPATTTRSPGRSSTRSPTGPLLIESVSMTGDQCSGAKRSSRRQPSSTQRGRPR